MPVEMILVADLAGNLDDATGRIQRRRSDLAAHRL
jgi:hypothetical protein